MVETAEELEDWLRQTGKWDEAFPFQKLFPKPAEYRAFLHGMHTHAMSVRMLRGREDEFTEGVRAGSQDAMRTMAGMCGFEVAFASPEKGWMAATFTRVGRHPFERAQ